MANSARRAVNRKKTDFDYFDMLTPEFRRVASNTAGNYDSKWFYKQMKAGLSAKKVAETILSYERELFLKPVKDRDGFKWVTRTAPMAIHEVKPFYDTRVAPEYA